MNSQIENIFYVFSSLFSVLPLSLSLSCPSFVVDGCGLPLCLWVFVDAHGWAWVVGATSHAASRSSEVEPWLKIWTTDTLPALSISPQGWACLKLIGFLLFFWLGEWILLGAGSLSSFCGFCWVPFVICNMGVANFDSSWVGGHGSGGGLGCCRLWWFRGKERKKS